MPIYFYRWSCSQAGSRSTARGVGEQTGSAGGQKMPEESEFIILKPTEQGSYVAWNQVVAINPLVQGFVEPADPRNNQHREIEFKESRAAFDPWSVATTVIAGPIARSVGDGKTEYP